MESIVWSLFANGSFILVYKVLSTLVITIILFQTDFFLLLFSQIYRYAIYGSVDSFSPATKSNSIPTGLVIIPSLLRNEDDFNAITTTVVSCGENKYPSDLVIIVSVDGRAENSILYDRLNVWLCSQQYTNNIQLYITGTEVRSSKVMAIDAATLFMKKLVADNLYPKFPDIYFSVDGDGVLSENALERLAVKLASPHHITGNPRRIVSGKIYIRPDLLWQGWKKFFTIEGQIYIQVAREFVMSNIRRYNWKMLPRQGVPGALYATWSELLLQAPHYMRFIQTLKYSDCFKWWLGQGAPLYSSKEYEPMPEALTGSTDDTAMSFLASIAWWKNGKLCLDSPATPLHAFGRLLRDWFIERSHGYEPQAIVYTYTPTTIKSLWNQRVRWNSSRFECAGRFMKPFLFNWEVGNPVFMQLSVVVYTVIELLVFYMMIPYVCMKGGSLLLGVIIGYLVQLFTYTIYTVISLLLERQNEKYWRVLYSIPLSYFYMLVIDAFTSAYGIIKDLFISGNKTTFVPEHTLIKGKTGRLAIFYRIKRFLMLCLRSAIYGDVPFSYDWFGWQETKYAPSGYEGWTTGKKPRSILFRKVGESYDD